MSYLQYLQLVYIHHQCVPAWTIRTVTIICNQTIYENNGIFLHIVCMRCTTLGKPSTAFILLWDVKSGVYLK